MKHLFSLFTLLLLFVTSGMGATVQTKAGWDTVKICIIWNSGTGTEEMPSGWQQKNGAIGDSTRSYVEQAISSVNKNNVKVYTGTSPQWASISNTANNLQNLKKEFGGSLPDVIAYINAGYEWDEHSAKQSTTPYALLKAASDSGVGIVAIGDDAAFDAKTIFPLAGYKGNGNIIQYHETGDNGGLAAPFMESAVGESGFSDVKISMNKSENAKLQDQGILFAVSATELKFKEWIKNGRGQADADVWDIDTNKIKLDNFAKIGYQSAMLDDWQLVPPAARSDLYKVIAALQNKLNRVVMLGYQPQYLEDSSASMQIVYNSLFWASKAKEMMKIATPVADPLNGSPNSVGKIGLTVDFPSDKSIYTIRYQINDGSWSDYSSSFDLPVNGATVTVKACAIPTSSTGSYTKSDTATFTYEYKDGPVLESARIIPGKIDLVSSLREADTLLVTFSKEMKDFSTTTPFKSLDRDSISYLFTLNELSQSGKNAKFVITSNTVKPARYLPENMKDSLAIDPKANLETIDGEKQDGMTNRFVPVQVDGISIPQIATPVASPNSGTTQSVTKVKISVPYPNDSNYYTLRYQIDGAVTGSSSKYTGEITLPKTGSSVTIRAVAITTDGSLWKTSDTMKVTFDYVGGPIIETAELIQGSITDYQTSTFAPDTLLIRFNKDIEDVKNTMPFISYDENGDEYARSTGI